MMKLALLLFTLQVSAFNNPDILVLSRTSAKWSEHLLDTFEKLMFNLKTKISVYEYSSNLTLNYQGENLEQFVPARTQELLKQVERVLGMNFLQLAPQLSIEYPSYHLNTLKPEFKVSSLNSGIHFQGRIGFSELEIKAQKLSLALHLKSRDSGEPITVLQINVVAPRVLIEQHDSLSLELELALNKNEKQIALRFTHFDPRKLIEELRENPDLAKISYEAIELPSISLELAGRKVSVDAQKITRLIADNEEVLKELLLDELSKSLNSSMGVDLLAALNQIDLETDYWILPPDGTSFAFQLAIQEFYKYTQRSIWVELGGDFCLRESFVERGESCTSVRQVPVAQSRITKEELKNSKREIESEFSSRDDISMLISISEDYLNKALATSVEKGAWAEPLNEAQLKLGAKYVQLRLDERGDTAKIYLDALYHPKKLQGFLIGERELRFPIALIVKFRFEDEKRTLVMEDGSFKTEVVPHIIFNVHDVVLDTKLLYRGLPQYGLPSTIPSVRRIFRKRTVKTIIKELMSYKAPEDLSSLKNWKGMDLPPTAVPSIKGLRLEVLKKAADGRGRVNFFAREEDFHQ